MALHEPCAVVSIVRPFRFVNKLRAEISPVRRSIRTLLSCFLPSGVVSEVKSDQTASVLKFVDVTTDPLARVFDTL